MFDWLFERLPGVFLVLGVLAVLSLAFWWRSRKRMPLIFFLAFAVLAGVYFLLSVLVVTDRRQLTESVQEMAAGVRDRNLDRSFAQISEDFRFNNLGKNEFRQRADSAVRGFDIRDCEVWDIEIDDFSRDSRNAHVHFDVKIKGNFSQKEFLRCRAEFTLDRDNHWRLRGFQLFNPFVESSTPLQLPF